MKSNKADFSKYELSEETISEIFDSFTIHFKTQSWFSQLEESSQAKLQLIFLQGKKKALKEHLQKDLWVDGKIDGKVLSYLFSIKLDNFIRRGTDLSSRLCYSTRLKSYTRRTYLINHCYTLTFDIFDSALKEYFIPNIINLLVDFEKEINLLGNSGENEALAVIRNLIPEWLKIRFMLEEDIKRHYFTYKPEDKNSRLNKLKDFKLASKI